MKFQIIHAVDDELNTHVKCNEKDLFTGNWLDRELTDAESEQQACKQLTFEQTFRNRKRVETDR